MSQSRSRRPLPAIVFLLGLLIFASIVWWRVLSRNEDASASKKPHSTPTTIAGRPGSPSACSKNPVHLPRASSVTVSVFNGTGRDGVARTVQGELQKRGFVVPRIDTAPSVLNGIAQIQFGPSGKLAATLLGMHVRGAHLTSSNRADAQLDLVLGTSFSSLATPSQVAAAVAAAGRRC